MPLLIAAAAAVTLVLWQRHGTRRQRPELACNFCSAGSLVDAATLRDHESVTDNLQETFMARPFGASWGA